MDGLAEANQILLVGSANNLESVDRAVLDRFDLKIEFPLPEGDQLQAALGLDMPEGPAVAGAGALGNSHVMKSLKSYSTSTGGISVKLRGSLKR